MTLHVSSSEFEDGGRIPRRFGYEEQNVNPRLELSGVPDDAESLALVVDDPDAKPVAGKVWDHWVVWNIPPDTTEIPEDWSPSAAGAVQGKNDYGERGYGGPNPPNEMHEYRFRVYALDTEIDLPGDADANALQTTMRGHIIDEAELREPIGPDSSRPGESSVFGKSSVARESSNQSAGRSAIALQHSSDYGSRCFQPYARSITGCLASFIKSRIHSRVTSHSESRP